MQSVDLCKGANMNDLFYVVDPVHFAVCVFVCVSALFKG